MTTLFNVEQVKEMTKNMATTCLFVDVNDDKEILKCVFCGVAFCGFNATQEMKQQALAFAKTFY